MPEALIEKLLGRAGSTRVLRRSNTPPRRWSTSSCISIRRRATIDVVAFERAELGADRHARGDRACVTARRISSTFSPAAIRPAYYSYLWSESSRRRRLRGVRGDGRHLRSRSPGGCNDFVYSAGGSRDYEAAYRGFRGRAAVARGAVPQARARPDVGGTAAARGPAEIPGRELSAIKILQEISRATQLPSRAHPQTSS